ncbi:MAG TPA: class I SAM-dependent methyltransferase [Dehalococcoidia bacterium]|nr:class I SAM-dependent methyltransferase [Dehalococcoidia bacterium]
MVNIAELVRNVYFWVVAILLLIVVAAHYTTVNSGTTHIVVIVLGIIPTGFCAVHFGYRPGFVVGLLLGLLLLADMAMFSVHTVNIEMSVELVTVAGLVGLGVVAGNWADRSRENGPHLEPGQYFWDFAAKTAVGQYITEREDEFLRRCLVDFPNKPKVIVDAGAGSGRFETLLASFASWVITTEIDQSLVHRLSQAGNNVLPLLVSDTAKCLPLADDSVDCVVCMEVPALAEQNWFYAECLRVLRPGGAIIVSVTNRLSWKGALAVLRPKRYVRKHARYYQRTIRDVRLTLKRDGFAIRRVAGLNWIPFPHASDSPLVRPVVVLEKTIGLHRLNCLSPWVLVEARKPLL